MANTVGYPFIRTINFAGGYNLYSDAAVRLVQEDMLFEAAASGVSGTLSATEGQDTASFTGALVYSGSLAATDAQDSATLAGGLVYSGALAATEAQDTASFNGAVAGATVSGSLSATEGQDTAAFDGSATGATQHLHGRKPRRGRVVKFADELPPEVVEAPKIEPLPSLETIRAKVAEAKQALEAVQIAQIRAKEREATAKAINALSERYDATLAALQQAEANERAWIRRLQDEDDFFLLAA